jgi:hypothetical protein
MQPSADISENLGTQLIFQLIDAYVSNRDEMCSASQLAAKLLHHESKAALPNWRQSYFITSQAALPTWRQSYFITSQAALPDWQRVLNVSNHTRQSASSNW